MYWANPAKHLYACQGIAGLQKRGGTLAQQFPALSLLIELPGPFNCRLGMRELLVVDNGHNAGQLAGVGGVFGANPE